MNFHYVFSMYEIVYIMLLRPGLHGKVKLSFESIICTKVLTVITVTSTCSYIKASVGDDDFFPFLIYQSQHW